MRGFIGSQLSFNRLHQHLGAADVQPGDDVLEGAHNFGRSGNDESVGVLIRYKRNVRAGIAAAGGGGATAAGLLLQIADETLEFGGDILGQGIVQVHHLGIAGFGGHVETGNERADSQPIAFVATQENTVGAGVGHQFEWWSGLGVLLVLQ